MQCYYACYAIFVDTVMTSAVSLDVFSQNGETTGSLVLESAVPETPEPATTVLFVLGLISMVAVRHRRGRRHHEPPEGAASGPAFARNRNER